MILRLEERDRSRALDYLCAEPSYNVFAIGDIENFGFDRDFQDVWADTDSSGAIRAIVLRYYNNHIVYSRSGDFDAASVRALLEAAAEGWMLSGKESLVAPLASSLGLAKVEGQFLAELDRADSLAPEAGGADFGRISLADFDEVIALHGEIEEFGAFGPVAAGIRQNLESGTGRTFAARVAGRIVSSASSAAENTRSAMIIGVATAKEHRRRGYATRGVSMLCRELLWEGRVACLFYHNPEAGRIYRRLGFREIGRWAMASR